MNFNWIKKIDPNLVIAIGVLIASFAGLFIYVRQTKIMSEQTQILLEQTKANSWPHISIELYRGYSNDSLSTYRFEVTNKGTGPAILEQTRISFGDSYIENWVGFYQAIELPDTIRGVHGNSNINGRVLAANESLNLVDWSNSKVGGNTDLMEYIEERANQISIEICYKSIHGDTWTVKRVGFKSDLELNERTQQKSCPSNEAPIFKE